ncbi:hypothetical protein N7467_003458 [Penicillium canescens]|nr:hypothetical protein N7467_003458 [Penicillium canescens]
MFDSPAQCTVPFDRPVAPPLLSMNVMPQPCAQDGVSQVWLRGRDALAAVVRKLGDLVGEHLGDSVLAKQLVACFRASSVV